MADPKKPRSGPGSRTGAAARSGPSIADAQRQRPARRVTLSPEAWALLDAQRAESEDSVSAQLDALVLSRGAEERHLSPDRQSRTASHPSDIACEPAKPRAMLQIRTKEHAA